jgi:hypothetical protein
VSALVRYAIYYLSSKRAEYSGKYGEYLENDLEALSANLMWGKADILRQFTTHAGRKVKFAERGYYDNVLLPLLGLLEQSTFQWLEQATQYDARMRSPSPVQELGFFSGADEENEPTARQKLERYRELRKNEWGDFHYNFLGIMSVLYLISDYLSGTNYYNSKHRAVKISAVDKLLTSDRRLANEDFTSGELRALHEGRLGKLVKSIGGDLDGLLDELYPTQEIDPDVRIQDDENGANAGAAEDGGAFLDDLGVDEEDSLEGFDFS